MLSRPITMFLWLFFLGNVISAPADEYFGIIHEGEMAMSDDKYIKYIVPGYLQPKNVKQLNLNLKDVVSENSENYHNIYILQKHIESGHAMKGLTFNLYDDNMRETAIALFRLLKGATDDNLPLLKDWATNNINKDIVDYTLRLLSLYKYVDYDLENNPPFINKPNYFVNTETIHKALKLKISNGKFDEKEGMVNQYYREENIITINTNYSGWNFEKNECQYRLNYFREDIGLNSYYYGIHLMHPFWMSNDELSEIDPRYAEQYYFLHKQLLTRSNLEEEHVKYQNGKLGKCMDNFMPFLVYDNGIPFPTRLNPNNGLAYNVRIKTIDIAIKECLDRGFIYMDNSIKVTLTDENYVDLLAKLIRANFEGPQVSKIVKEFYGYGANGYPIDRYNPAPSVLHHPETTLRDPIYWSLIENIINYFLDFSKKLQPYEFVKYETDEFEIVNNSFSKITTYFDYYKFKLNNIFGGEDHKSKSLVYTARQKRLNHIPFTLNLTVSSMVNKTGNIRLFLGPQCEEMECWRQYHRFFELDIFPYSFVEGMNYISWSSETSSRYSFDDYYNLESNRQPKDNNYDMFKFPANMIIPRGLGEGLKLTLFVMITPQNDVSDTYEPFGFPFHMPAFVDENSAYGNYKFYNVSVFHKEGRKENKGYFSSFLS